VARDTKWQETKRLANRVLHICPLISGQQQQMCVFPLLPVTEKKSGCFRKRGFLSVWCCQHLRVWLSITSHLKIGSWLSWRHHWPPLLWLAKHGAVLAPRALGALQSSQQLMRHLAAWASSDAPAVGTWAGHPASQVPFSRVWQLADGTTWKKMVNGPDPTSE